MTTLYDVPPNALIARLAEHLQSDGKVKPPAWASEVKTGNHNQFPPAQEDWWYTRCAAVLRKVAVHGPVGVTRMRTAYGGNKNRGSKPDRFKPGSGAIIRDVLQQMEQAGLITKSSRGRTVTSSGRAFLDAAAREVATSAENV